MTYNLEWIEYVLTNRSSQKTDDMIKLTAAAISLTLLTENSIFCSQQFGTT